MLSVGVPVLTARPQSVTIPYLGGCRSHSDLYAVRHYLDMEIVSNRVCVCVSIHSNKDKGRIV